ncbi:MAG: HAMP domain-containing sensor histidine kinase [Pseudomonadota bacterium]
MNRQQSIIAARGLTDEEDRLVQADEPLAELQEACGGSVPGVLAVPELLDLVRQCRELGLRIAREFSVFDGRDMVSGFVRIHPVSAADSDPDAGSGGCELLIENWLAVANSDVGPRKTTEWLDEADRAAADVTAHLDARQNLQFLASFSPDARELSQAVEENPGKLWSEYIALEGIAHEQPLHWRLLDGALATIPGSERSWRVRLLPRGPANASPVGFELLLIAVEPLASAPAQVVPEEEWEPEHSRLIGSALTPVLRQPIARIIANAETIHARLAGPLRDEYSEYAANIASAGQHLSGMLDDLADLEVVESPEFETAKERVDLIDVARRSAGILGVRAQARGIAVNVVEHPETPFALAEFRRVLQILINLIGNAIAYSPEGSEVTVQVATAEQDRICVIVSDQGPGVTPEQAARVFDKFERLGRDSDGGNDSGSGLGLFISRKLARAMGGELEVLPPQVADDLVGAEFQLTLPAFGTI